MEMNSGADHHELLFNLSVSVYICIPEALSFPLKKMQLMVKLNKKEESGTEGMLTQPKMNDHQQNSPVWLRKGFPLLWFAIAGFIIFGQTINFGYTYLDDQTLIMSNMENLKSFSYLTKAFSEDVFHTSSGRGFYYRPVLTLSFMVDAMVGKGSFAMFHFSNIIYHLLATFLLFLFFIEAGYDRIRSFLFSLLFLVHPMVVQAVAWVPGRNDTLLAIFIFASFIFWLKFLKNGNILNVLLHLFFYLLALFTKENAVVLPFLIILYSALVLHVPRRKYIVAGMAWIIITFVWGFIRYHALGGASEVTFSTQIISMVRNIPAVLPFLGKVIFPFDLSVFPILADMKISMVLGIIALVVMGLVCRLSARGQWTVCFFGFAWFLTFLIPSFVSINNQIPNFSEHRVYLSLAGLLLLFIQYRPAKTTVFYQKVTAGALAALLLLFSVLSFLHTRNFKDQFTFWQNAVDTSPSHAFNYNNLGAMYFLNDNLEQAEPLLRKAVQINPSEPMANGNLGLIYMRTNRLAEAEKYYLEEIRINPAYDHVYYNLGLLYFNNSHTEEGIFQWEKTLTINPSYSDAYKALLFAYEKLGRKADYERIAAQARVNGIAFQ
jgi:hypothetical protein